MISPSCCRECAAWVSAVSHGAEGSEGEHTFFAKSGRLAKDPLAYYRCDPPHPLSPGKLSPGGGPREPKTQEQRATALPGTGKTRQRVRNRSPGSADRARRDHQRHQGSGRKSAAGAGFCGSREAMEV